MSNEINILESITQMQMSNGNTISFHSLLFGLLLIVKILVINHLFGKC